MSSKRCFVFYHIGNANVEMSSHVSLVSEQVTARNVQAEYNTFDGTSRPDLTELVFTVRFTETPQSPRSFLSKEHTLPALKMAVTFLQGSSERPALLQASAPNSFALVPATEDASAAEASSGRTRSSLAEDGGSSRCSSLLLPHLALLSKHYGCWHELMRRCRSCHIIIPYC